MLYLHYLSLLLISPVVLARIDGDHLQLANSFACAGAGDGQFVRRSASCAAYYYCHEGGRAAAGECERPLHFDARLQRCATAYSVDCTRCSAGGVQNLADPLDGRRYYQCVEGVRQHRWCSEGLIFDPTEGDCNLPHFVVANTFASDPQSSVEDYHDDDHLTHSIDNRICASFAHHDYVQFGDPEDCARYYVCVRGIGYRERCAANLLFNAHRGFCDRAGRVNFCQTFGPVILPQRTDLNGPARPDQPGQPGQQPGGQPGQSNQPNPPSSNPQPSNPQPPPSGSNPAARPPPAGNQFDGLPSPTWSGEYLCTKPNGNFSVPDSCSGYVHCYDGEQSIVFHCPAGQFFHTVYGECSRFGQEHCYSSQFEHRACRREEGYFGVPGRCDRYVWCEEGRVRLRYECGAGEWWSVPEGRCVRVKPSYC